MNSESLGVAVESVVELARLAPPEYTLCDGLPRMHADIPASSTSSSCSVSTATLGSPGCTDDTSQTADDVSHRVSNASSTNLVVAGLS